MHYLLVLLICLSKNRLNLIIEIMQMIQDNGM